jgi:transcriptional regulator with XRE-family HTH domain
MGSMQELAALVKRGRRRREMRGMDLASAIGKDPAYVSRLEHGMLREIPEPETIRALAEALGIDETRLVAAIGYRVVTEEASGQPFPLGSIHAEVVRLLHGLNEEQALQMARYAIFLKDPPLVDV